jgi:alpha-beta hydrolase superfamily lysophospholipase
MNIHESTWTSPDGVVFYTRAWQPEVASRAVVLLIHGLGEHCSRYDHVAAAFAAQGIATTSFDLRGHGRTPGPRGHIPSFELVDQDIDHFLTAAAEAFPRLPRFLYGHSMGGELVLYYTITRHPHLAGVVCTSPGLGTSDPMPAAKMLAARVLYRLAPRVSMPNGLDLANLSHDANVIQAYRDDPLNTPLVSARLGLDILRTGPWIVEHAGEFDLPLLLMQGSGDHIVLPEATRRFAAGMPKELITYREWEGLYHELHNEPQKELVIGAMTEWLNQHITAPAAA